MGELQHELIHVLHVYEYVDNFKHRPTTGPIELGFHMKVT